MIKNIWAITKVYCGNHDEPIEMQFKSGPQSVFYACPEYDNKYKGGKACPNRVSYSQVDDLLKKISDIIETHAMEGSDIDLTNYQFTHKMLQCRVLEHKPTSLKISVINRKALA